MDNNLTVILISLGIGVYTFGVFILGYHKGMQDSQKARELAEELAGITKQASFQETLKTLASIPGLHIKGPGFEIKGPEKEEEDNESNSKV